MKCGNCSECKHKRPESEHVNQDTTDKFDSELTDSEFTAEVLKYTPIAIKIKEQKAKPIATLDDIAL